MSLPYVFGVVVFVVRSTVAADPTALRKSNIGKAANSLLSTKSLLKEDEPNIELPVWAYWAIGAGVVFLALLSYLIYRYLTWVPKKKVIKAGVAANPISTTSSETETHRLITTKDQH